MLQVEYLNLSSHPVNIKLLAANWKLFSGKPGKPRIFVRCCRLGENRLEDWP